MQQGISVFGAEESQRKQLASLIRSLFLLSIKLLQEQQHEKGRRKAMAKWQHYVGHYTLVDGALLQQTRTEKLRGSLDITIGDRVLEVACTLPGLASFDFRLVPYEDRTFRMQGVGRSLPEYASGGEFVTFDAPHQQGQVQMRWRDLLFQQN